MVNENRGEISIKSRDSHYILRPTFQAICAIEGELGRSIIDMLLEIPDKKLKMSEVAVIVKHGAAAYKDNTTISDEEIGKAIQSAGLINVMPKTIQFLEMAVGMQSKEG